MRNTRMNRAGRACAAVTALAFLSQVNAAVACNKSTQRQTLLREPNLQKLITVWLIDVNLNV